MSRAPNTNRDVIGSYVVTVQNDVAAAMNAAGIRAIAVVGPDDPHLNQVILMFEATVWPPREGPLLRLADDVAAELHRRGVTPTWAQPNELQGDVLDLLAHSEGVQLVKSAIATAVKWLPTDGDGSADTSSFDESAYDLISPSMSPVVPGQLRWRTGAELLTTAAETPDWLIQWLIPLAAVTEIMAMVKAGKTTLLMQICASLISGQPFLGRESVRTPVVYLSEERNKSLAHAIKRAGIANLRNLHVLLREDARSLQWPALVMAAMEKCQEVNARVLMIDTISDWASLAGDDENSSGAALEAMRPVQKAASEGLAVICTRHVRKSGGPLGTAGRGSTAFSGAADVLYQLTSLNTKGHPSRRLLEGAGRQDGIPERLVLDYVNGRYVELGTELGVDRAEAVRVVREILSATAEPLLTSEIQRRAKPLSESSIKRALKDLADEGAVTRFDNQGANRRATGWTLNR